MDDPNTTAPTDHIGLEVLSNAECDALLDETRIGRIAFVADGDVVIFPVNYRYIDHTIVFRTADGTKLEVATNHQPVAFEIDGYDLERQNGMERAGQGDRQVRAGGGRGGHARSARPPALGTPDAGEALGENLPRRDHGPQDRLIFRSCSGRVGPDSAIVPKKEE